MSPEFWKEKFPFFYCVKKSFTYFQLFFSKVWCLSIISTFFEQTYYSLKMRPLELRTWFFMPKDFYARLGCNSQFIQCEMFVQKTFYRRLDYWSKVFLFYGHFGPQTPTNVTFGLRVILKEPLIMTTLKTSQTDLYYSPVYS